MKKHQENNQEEILNKLRKLMIPNEECLILFSEICKNWNRPSDMYYQKCIKSLELINQLKELLGYKEDELQPLTQYRNGKLFNDD